MSKKEKILITGATGFLGQNTQEVLRELNQYNVIAVSSSDYDLMIEAQVGKMFKDIAPDYVVHLAARSGGIYSNRKNPADYYYKNNQLIALTFHHAYLHGVKKILVPMGGCSYPANAESPIKEETMWDGFSQIQSAGYSMAKKMVLVQSWAYKQQYNFDSLVIVPGNMYGKNDNYSLTDSHVIPAMIRRFYEAKMNDVPELIFWGSGEPQRDFVYVRDVAELIPYFLFDYDLMGPVNISTGTSTSIKELADTISSLTGYKGTVKWDTSQPDGQMIKIFSVEKLNETGKSCDTELKTGLKKTIGWFKQNYPGGIRL